MTTLTFMHDAAHLAVKALLGSVTNFDLYDQGDVRDSDGDAKTIGAPLPYVVYAVSAPFAWSQRAGGWGGKEWNFSLTYTHSSSLGVKSVMQAVRELIDGTSLMIEGKERRIRRSDPQAAIVPDADQDWTRPGGAPLYFASEWWRIT